MSKGRNNEDMAQ